MGKYAEVLRQCGLKSTKSRNAVLEVLTKEGRVLTAETVYKAVTEAGQPINFSTVYRILEMFTSCKLTEKIFLPDEGKYGFLLRKRGHTHRLICLSCHKVVDLPHCPLGEYEQQVAEKTDFELVGHTLELYGYCPECRKKRQP